MTNNFISIDEANVFKSLSLKKKVDCMEAYLIGVNGHRYNMQEVGSLVFGDENYSFTVSLIHRCYNFSGQNGAKYCNGCKFEKTYGYRVTRKDIEAFVGKYPEGTFNKGITFEDFLKTRVHGFKENDGRPQNQTIQRKSQPVSRTKASTDVVENSYVSDSTPAVDKDVKAVLFGMGVVGILILLVLLLTGGLFKHWVISLIILFFTIVLFDATKKK